MGTVSPSLLNRIDRLRRLSLSMTHTPIVCLPWSRSSDVDPDVAPICWTTFKRQLLTPPIFLYHVKRTISVLEIAERIPTVQFFPATHAVLSCSSRASIPQ